jgi:hypothetical protein
MERNRLRTSSNSNALRCAVARPQCCLCNDVATLHVAGSGSSSRRGRRKSASCGLRRASAGRRRRSLQRPSAPQTQYPTVPCRLTHAWADPLAHDRARVRPPIAPLRALAPTHAHAHTLYAADSRRTSHRNRRRTARTAKSRTFSGAVQHAAMRRSISAALQRRLATQRSVLHTHTQRQRQRAAISAPRIAAQRHSRPVSINRILCGSSSGGPRAYGRPRDWLQVSVALPLWAEQQVPDRAV